MFNFYIVPSPLCHNCTIWSNKVCYISLKTDSVMDMGNFYLFKNLNWCAVVMVYAQMEIKHHAATRYTPSPLLPHPGGMERRDEVKFVC